MKNVTVIRAYRGGICENIHIASTAVCSETGTVCQMFPDLEESHVFLRSAAKPFQALPLYQNPQSKDIPLEEWAIICASHSASAIHLKLVHRLLERAQATEADLQCGPHMPTDESTSKQLICSQSAPTKIHNNCSGKHAGMLLACRYYGWPLETYLDPDHPLQQAIRKIIEHYSETDAIITAIDGCGAPVFGLPLASIAKLFQNLAIQPELAHLYRAMVTHPELVGDAHRIDSNLMKISQGNIVAKVGAEGFLGLAHRERKEGLAIKMHDGSNEMRDRLVITLLEKLDWLSFDQAEALRQMPQFSSHRVNTQGKVIGHYTFEFPNSVPV